MFTQIYAEGCRDVYADVCEGLQENLTSDALPWLLIAGEGLCDGSLERVHEDTVCDLQGTSLETAHQ